MRAPFRKGDRLTLTPERLGARGEAEAVHEGWRVRIPGGFPGETATVTIEHVSKGGPMAVARYESAAAPHAARRDAPCPIHDTCGGCGLQGFGEAAVLAEKVRNVRPLLPEARWLDPIPSPLAFGYRSKTFMLPQAREWKLVLGARPPRGPDLVDTSGCNVLRPELEALAAVTRSVLSERFAGKRLPLSEPADDRPGLRAALLRCNRRGGTQVTLVHRGPDDGLFEEAARAVAQTGAAVAGFLQRHDGPGNRICSDENERLVAGEGPLRERFEAGRAAVEVAIPPTAFFQGNPEVAESLYALAAGAVAGLRIAELYCGAGVAGLLALHLQPEGELRGVDKAPRAVASALESARENGVADRCRFEVGSAEELLPRWVADGACFDALLLNPPRGGCHPDVLAAASSSGASRLAYMSCNPATLGRDADALAGDGWRVESLQPADMFPQTPHLEVLALFAR